MPEPECFSIVAADGVSLAGYRWTGDAPPRGIVQALRRCRAASANTWNGANGTGFFVDPRESLVVVFGTAAPGDLRKYYREQVQDLVYGALLEPRAANTP